MINRKRTKSQYIFNSENGILEKVADISTIDKIANELAKEETIDSVTDIAIITAEDNLIHNYFYSYETSWDASNCLQMAIIKMPKVNQENVNYWATYTGQLTIYLGSNFVYDYVNKTTHTTEQKAAQSLVKYWDNSKIKPYFRGEVDHIKEYQTSMSIYVKNIGSRFQQKMPDEFRQKFVYNQNVRDCFQAICEFLGVQYICPPKTVTDAAGEEIEDAATENDGTQNDVGKQVVNASKLVNAAKNAATNAAKKTTNNASQDNDTSSSNIENNEDTSTTNTGITDNAVNDIINGYDDISFDANGSIVHGSTVIETSPDMAHTLVAMEEHPFEKYLDDETGIVEKVNNFLNGEMFEELHNYVMDYGAITIEPKSTTTSDATVVPGAGATEGTNSTSENNSLSGSGSVSSSFGNTSSRAREKNGWINGQYYINGKIYLSKAYINSLTPEQARQKRTGAYANHTYTDDTMQKLLWRSLGTVLK